MHHSKREKDRAHHLRKNKKKKNSSIPYSLHILEFYPLCRSLRKYTASNPRPQLAKGTYVSSLSHER